MPNATPWMLPVEFVSVISTCPLYLHLHLHLHPQHDPLSACNCTPPYSGENGISARCDLNPKDGVYPFSALGHRDHGGTDMKLTTTKLVRRGGGDDVCVW